MRCVECYKSNTKCDLDNFIKYKKQIACSRCLGKRLECVINQPRGKKTAKPKPKPKSTPTSNVEEDAKDDALPNDDEVFDKDMRLPDYDQLASLPLLDRDPMIPDLHDAVEHLVAVGSKVRRDNWRRQEFTSNHQPQMDALHAQSMDMPPPNTRMDPIDGTTLLPTNYLHAEDTRVYGKDGLSKRSWPVTNIQQKGMRGRKRNPLQTADDNQWNLEHGDTINPIAFAMASLSQVPVEESQRCMVDGNNLNLKPEASLPDDQVLRAMVLRCWERAVHASSTTMVASTTTTNAAQRGSSSVDDSTTPFPIDMSTQCPSNTAGSNAMMDDERYSSANAIAACKALRIGTISKYMRRPFKCLCTLEFESNEKLTQHFYGNGKTRGCCWPLVHSEQRSVIDAAFQRHVKAQAHGLLDIVMAKAKSRISDTVISPETKRPRLFNWYDVLKFAEQAPSSKAGDKDSNATAATGEQQQEEADESQSLLTTAIDKLYGQSDKESVTIKGFCKTLAQQFGVDVTVETKQIVKQRLKDLVNGRVASSVDNANQLHPVLGTIEAIDPREQKLLVLNNQVIGAARQRLIDRYADVPF
jgi:hypothetical protein